ncbi:TetR/AcrR family transcriptional regulator [Streptomyces sp. NPDC057253]|uniref:TetR/AcrR family transcriptional regulator n=1 Tax=Streptomyces sp. NPDC057253 TaxID=3346069 RepID=UPI003634C580
MMTRQEVVKTARKLFAEHGYTQTTVERIAREARVSPATVYAQCRGKEGLLRTLMDIWTTSPTVERIIVDSLAPPTGRAKLEVLAEGYFDIRAEAGDIVRIVERAAASSPATREFLDIANQRHIEALETIVRGIAADGDLAEGLSIEDTAKIIYFHFRIPQIDLAVEEFGWGVDRTKKWLFERVAAAILKG